MKRFFLFSLAILMLGACRKKEDPAAPAPTGPAKVTVSFENVAGSQPLVLDSVWYRNANGDSVKVSEYKYYISNVVLESDNTKYNEEESYHLIDQRDDNSKVFELKDIPEKTYNKISFMVGVDSRHNTAGAQTGALDPIHGMFWDWNQGYIMAKMEGYSPQSPIGGRISYHIAGFKGEYSVLVNVTLNLPQPLIVKEGSIHNIHLKADMLEWFKTPSTVSINQTSVVGAVGPDALRFANNYADMFSVDHID
ncbi:MAG TPA: MbnP family protein [Flavipsychrobacter sp.]|nr:MbnP family protein [Flavipsychrobacter sp.]